MNFLEFFVWGSYLTSLGGYLFATLQFKGEEVGLVFTTLGIASVFMPTILGIVADKWMNAERVLGLSHIIGSIALYLASTITNPNQMFWVMLLVSMFYMPTIALNNAVSYNVLQRNGLDSQKVFPPIRVWGTVGFICAMWAVDILHWTLSSNQLLFASGAALLMGLYSFTMPACPPQNSQQSKSIITSLGLDAFVLFKNKKMAVFFLFAMFLGGALQITNQWGVAFLDHFKSVAEYKETFAVKYPNILISISQISETLFILTIPFFLKRYGIKKVMIISIFAWVLRFGLFGAGNPGAGLSLLVLSMIVYGMAFDFFNISGSLFVEKEAPKSIRASAQGLFMFMTNGIGAMIGSYCSGLIVSYFTVDNSSDWSSIWFTFSGYALVLGIIFPFVFSYQHDPKKMEVVIH
jgi:NHS family xanthosine MFS transporter